MASLQAFERALAALPQAYPGPGGAVAVLRDGEVLARHAWGWADVDRQITFTSRTLFRICSISKQFTCAAMLDLHPDPAVLDGDVRTMLPLLQEPAPGRSISRTTSPDCATTGRWRCCAARRSRRGLARWRKRR